VASNPSLVRATRFLAFFGYTILFCFFIARIEFCKPAFLLLHDLRSCLSLISLPNVSNVHFHSQ
jgi:hypothetical protein